MDNKLVKINAEIAVKDKNGVDSLLKTFAEDILLFTTKISNTYKIQDKIPLLELKVGNVLSFKLGSSKYEEHQIEIYDENNQIVGYVPEQDSIIFARLMNAGKQLGARVKSISQSRNIPLIEIDIYLTDF